MLGSQTVQPCSSMGLKRGTYKAVFLNSPLTEFLLRKPIILLVTASILDSLVYMFFPRKRLDCSYTQSYSVEPSVDSMRPFNEYSMTTEVLGMVNLIVIHLSG